MNLKFNRFLEVVEVHVLAKFHGSGGSCGHREKKAENNTVVATADSIKIINAGCRIISLAEVINYLCKCFISHVTMSLVSDIDVINFFTFFIQVTFFLRF